MNSRSSINESNLVNFSPDLESLDALDKEPLLSFPFDHLYACHSQSSDCGQSLTLDKNVDISTHLLVQPDPTIQEKNAEILSLRNQNKKLKELLIFHLDLIQQQNDVITNREKSLNTVQDEVDNLRQKVDKSSGKHLTLAQRNLNLPPVFHAPSTCTVTSASPSSVTPSPQRPGLFNTFDEILGTKDTTDCSYLYNIDTPKPFGHDPFDLGSPAEALADLPELLPTDLPSILDTSPLTPLQPDFNMIERLTSIKQEAKPPEPPPREPIYTITTNSGMPVIKKAKNRKRLTSIGSLSRMPKRPKPEPSTIYDNEINSVNRKEQMMSTYGKSKEKLLRYPYAGSLSDRLQLIDTTPTGEDPYQLGEAEMREQSPIPKLVLPKSNRVRLHTGEGYSLNTPATATTSSRRIYDPVPEPKPKKSKKSNKCKTNQRKSNAKISTTSTYSDMSSARTSTATAPKKEVLSWEPFSKRQKLSSLGDFSYGETSLNLSSAMTSSGELLSSGSLLPSSTLLTSSNLNLYTASKFEKINPMTDKNIFAPGQSGDESLEASEASFETEVTEPRTKEHEARTGSLAGSSTTAEDGNAESRRGAESKRGGRNRALSSASSSKREKAPAKPKAARRRGGYRGKRGSLVPVPPLTTSTPYHTALGHPDISWYLGHDPDVKKEDVEQLAENTSSNVEVPRWREMMFTSLPSAEGTENTDDEVYRKRHQKLEAEERRQLRWHMRRVREQRHVERLRRRHRDPWAACVLRPSPTYSMWPTPLRDLQLIEITDILPVMAFGEDVPKLPEAEFVLPWVRTSKAQKRSKRSKTLH